MVSRVWADREKIIDTVLAVWAVKQRRNLVSKLLAEDRTMWYATKKYGTEHLRWDPAERLGSRRSYQSNPFGRGFGT
jgi:hypothetical protein